jgi:hypothetical protein
MRHIDDGTLRRLVDEPLAISSHERAHYATCTHCQERYTGIARTAAEVAVVLSSRPAPTVNATAALATMRHELAKVQPRRSLSAYLGGTLAHYRRQVVGGTGAAATVAALVGALTLTPAGSFAQSFISIFQPKSVTAVQVTSADLRKLQGLSRLGTIHVPGGESSQSAGTAAAAGTLAGMHVVGPATLPAGVPNTVKYQVQPSTSASFTFSAAKARQEAVRSGKSLPAMPVAMDGSTLQVTLGAGVIAVYGQKNDLPALVVGQMKAPTVSSTGVSAQQMENYLLSLPEVSPQLAAQIRAIGKPSSVLALPIPIDLAHSQDVQIQGVKGVAVGDNTGLGSVAIWEKDGIIYGVGGALTQDQVLAVANGLR